jgi:Fur family ferric uptake transcriptional regulator
MEVMQAHKKHLSANQVYEAIKPHLPALSPSTVYRALERLGKLGKISVSDMGTGAAVYELVDCCGTHHHIVCKNCGQVTILPVDLVESFFLQIKNMKGYQVTTNHLVLFGLCQDCSLKESQ